MDLNPRESNLEDKLRRECAPLGWLVIKVGFDGWPDNVVVAEWGVVGWIELKRRNEPPTARQELRIEELKARQQLAMVVQSRVQLDRFMRLMRERVDEAREKIRV